MYKSSEVTIMALFVANVRGVQGTAVLAESNTAQNAYIELIATYGKSNVITYPESIQSQAQIDQVRRLINA